MVAEQNGKQIWQTYRSQSCWVFCLTPSISPTENRCLIPVRVIFFTRVIYINILKGKRYSNATYQLWGPRYKALKSEWPWFLTLQGRSRSKVIPATCFWIVPVFLVLLCCVILCFQYIQVKRKRCYQSVKRHRYIYMYLGRLRHRWA